MRNGIGPVTMTADILVFGCLLAYWGLPTLASSRRHLRGLAASQRT